MGDRTHISSGVAAAPDVTAVIKTSDTSIDASTNTNGFLTIVATYSGSQPIAIKGADSTNGGDIIRIKRWANGGSGPYNSVVTPASGTINGGSSTFSATNSNVYEFISDGVSDWIRIWSVQMQN